MFMAGNCLLKRKKVKLICPWPGTAVQNKQKVKLIGSWPGTAVQKKKERKKPETFGGRR